MNARDGLEYIWIPSGEFWMGCVPSDAGCNADERPRHRVRLTRGFWVGKTEVTVAALMRFVAATSYWLPGSARHNVEGTHPAVDVGWADADAFCRWTGGRLPTEAEWEYVARGGSGESRYAWGDGRLPVRAGRPLANVADESHFRRPGYDIEPQHDAIGYHDGFVERAPACSFAPNGFGLCDTTGNVWEWVADWYAREAYDALGGVDPKGPPSGTERVARGGSYYDDPRFQRVSYRAHGDPAERLVNRGIRCVCDALPRSAPD